MTSELRSEWWGEVSPRKGDIRKERAFQTEEQYVHTLWQVRECGVKYCRTTTKGGGVKEASRKPGRAASWEPYKQLVATKSRAVSQTGVFNRSLNLPRARATWAERMDAGWPVRRPLLSPNRSWWELGLRQGHRRGTKGDKQIPTSWSCHEVMS